MSTTHRDPDAQHARWQRFRNSRNTALASDYGWLTLTSFQWLEGKPAAVELAPGLWSTDGTPAFLAAVLDPEQGLLVGQCRADGAIHGDAFDKRNEFNPGSTGCGIAKRRSVSCTGRNGFIRF